MTRVHVAVLTIIALSCSVVHADDWKRFRGPNGSGIATDSQAVPDSWSPKENVKWNTELPGAGVSSPIIVGGKVFVTCYSGYGLDRGNPGDIKKLKRHLVCVDAATGDKLWDKSIDAVQPEDPYSGIGVTAHGYASHTPVTDGERVYVYFGKTGAFAFDMEGNQVWHKEVGKGSDPWKWGSSSSPVLYEDTVIVTASAESQSLVGLDTKTGEQKWIQKASGLDGLWSTPIIVEVDGRTDLVFSAPYEVWGMNPKNGKLRWYCEASNADQAHSSAVAGEDGVVFAFTGRGGGSVAVKSGGKGDVTESHRVWKGNDSDRFASPVYHDGSIHLVSSGILKSIDAMTGKVSSQVRLQGGGQGSSTSGENGGRENGGRGRGGRGGGGFGSLDYASPVIADGKLFYLNGKGEMFVFKLGEKLEQLSVNRVTEASESFGGTPAISDGRLFIRSDKKLYCIGK